MDAMDTRSMQPNDAWAVVTEVLALREKNHKLQKALTHLERIKKYPVKAEALTINQLHIVEKWSERKDIVFMQIDNIVHILQRTGDDLKVLGKIYPDRVVR